MKSYVSEPNFPAAVTTGIVEMLDKASMPGYLSIRDYHFVSLFKKKTNKYSCLL